MRIVVIGATGNVGTAVLKRLHRQDEVDETEIEMVGVARRLPNPGRHPYEGVEWHGIDIGDDDAVTHLTRAFQGADAVIHLAWLLQPNHDEATMQRTNLHGLRNVILAAVDAHVPHLLVASSVGAYSAGPKHRAVDESWATDGIDTSQYSRQKAAAERMLDALEESVPAMTVTRMRPGLVMHGAAGGEVARLFLGRLIPTGWIMKVRLPFLPVPAETVSQVVHESDLADAFWRATERGIGGAFNIATDPVMSPELLAEVLRTRWVKVPIAPLRALMAATWHLRLQNSDPGWLDIATQVPVMSTERAQTELDWHPTVGAQTALTELIEGVAERRTQRGSPALKR